MTSARRPPSPCPMRVITPLLGLLFPELWASWFYTANSASEVMCLSMAFKDPAASACSGIQFWNEWRLASTSCMVRIQIRHESLSSGSFGTRSRGHKVPLSGSVHIDRASDSNPATTKTLEQLVSNLLPLQHGQPLSTLHNSRRRRSHLGGRDTT